MRVYVEYVLIDNFIIDCLLLLLTAKLLKVSLKKGWLLFCSFLGSIIALCYPIFEFNVFLTYVIKFLGAFSICLPLTKGKSLKNTIIFVGVFYGLTFLFGGAIIAIYSCFNINYSSETSIALMFLPCFILYIVGKKIIKNIFLERTIKNNQVKATIINNNKTFNVKAFIDSGNFLTDTDGKGVIICTRKVFFNVVGNKIFNVKQKMTIKTITGEKQIFITKVETIKIYYNNKENIFNNVTMGVSEGFGPFDVLLGSWVLEDSNENKEMVSKIIS